LDCLSHLNTWLFPPVAVVRLFRKFVPYRGPWQDMAMPHPFINQVLRKVFSSERPAFGRISLPFGISLAEVLSPQTGKAQSNRRL